LGTGWTHGRRERFSAIVTQGDILKALAIRCRDSNNSGNLAFSQFPGKRFGGQYLYVYLTRFVKALAEKQLGCAFNDLSVLDWGCGKGHVSELIPGPGPKQSCDILSERDDSAFGQEVLLIKRFGIQVRPLEHEYILPYDSATFDVSLRLTSS